MKDKYAGLTASAIKKDGEKTNYNSPGLPVNGLPMKLADLCKNIAGAYNVPFDTVLMSALTMVTASTGALCQIHTDNYTNRPALMTMVVAPSGCGKSAPLETLMKPFFDIDREMLAKYKNAYDEWRKLPEKEQKTKDKPRKKQFVCGTVSDAALISFQRDNERGGLLYRDELTAVFTQAAGKNNEQWSQLVLEIFDQRPLKRDLKSEDLPIVTKHSCLSVIGGIQPRVLKRYIKPEFLDNGMMQRFIFSVFEPDDENDDENETHMLNPDLLQWWATTVNKLREIGNTAWVYELTEEARKVWREEHGKWKRSRKRYVRKDDDDNRRDYFRSAYDKTLISVCRLALTAHLLNCEKAGEDVTANVVRWAFACVPYIMEGHKKVYDMIFGTRVPKKMKQADVIRAFAELCKANGKAINQTQLAEITGISRVYISNCLNSKRK